MTLKEKAFFLGWDEGLAGRAENPFAAHTPEGEAWIEGYVEACLERDGLGHPQEWLDALEKRRAPTMKSIDFLSTLNQAAEAGDKPLFDKLWMADFITDAPELPVGLLKYFPATEYRLEVSPFPPEGTDKVMRRFQFTRTKIQ